MALRLFDMYCCQGGSARGYAAAGFRVTGMDIDPQPRYPYSFVRGDVLKVDRSWVRDNFDGIHASPICQGLTALRHAPGTKEHPNLIPETVEILEWIGLPWILENVEGAEPWMPGAITLCGTMFGLGADADRRYELQRHRLFMASFPISAPKPCDHRHPVIGVYGAHVRNRGSSTGGRGTKDFVGFDKPRLAAQAMGFEGATMAGFSEAIPPAYTEHLGRQMAAHIRHGDLAELLG